MPRSQRSRLQQSAQCTSRLVFNLCRRQLVLRRISEFDITNRPGILLYQPSHSFAALATQAKGQLIDKTLFNVFLPLRADSRELSGEDVGRTAAIRAMDDHNVFLRQANAGIVFLNRRILPGLDRSQVDARQALAA